TANAARTGGMAKALEVAFSGEAIMGMSVVGLGLAGVSLITLIFADTSDPNTLSIVNGFALGANPIALFAPVVGGICTKAADVGDRVGDVAGMGADLFESYVGSIIAAMVVGASLYVSGTFASAAVVALPLVVAAVGIVASIVATFFVRGGGNPAQSLRTGTFAAAILCLIGIYFASTSLLPVGGFAVFVAVAAGLVVG